MTAQEAVEMRFALAALFLATAAASPDLRIAVTPADAAVPVGKTVEHTLTVTNAGGDASNVEVSDVLPACTDLVSAKPSSGRCTPDRTTAVVCETGALAAGKKVTIVVTARATHPGTGAGAINADVPGSGYYPVGTTYTTTVIAPKAR